jgi:osmotically-inducible protein OsmY
MKPSPGSNADRETTPIDLHAPIDSQAAQRLRGSSYLALQDVRCIAAEDAIYLYGSLPSFYLKQVAQEIATRVEGVRRVINRIEVRGPASPTRPRRGSLGQELV